MTFLIIHSLLCSILGNTANYSRENKVKIFDFVFMGANDKINLFLFVLGVELIFFVFYVLFYLALLIL